MGFNKRYDGELCFGRQKTFQKNIRCTMDEIRMVEKLYPGKPFSFGVRSLIHDADHKTSKE